MLGVGPHAPAIGQSALDPARAPAWQRAAKTRQRSGANRVIVDSVFEGCGRRLQLQRGPQVGQQLLIGGVSTCSPTGDRGPFAAGPWPPPSCPGRDKPAPGGNGAADRPGSRAWPIPAAAPLRSTGRYTAGSRLWCRAARDPCRQWQSPGRSAGGPRLGRRGRSASIMARLLSAGTNRGLISTTRRNSSTESASRPWTIRTSPTTHRADACPIRIFAVRP